MTTPWWKGAILYHIYIRSFFDSDGDGHGDLPGVLAKLDYISALGVDGLWLSPIHPSPDRDWGYDTSDYDGVHPAYGTLEDVQRLGQVRDALRHGDIKAAAKVGRVYTVEPVEVVNLVRDCKTVSDPMGSLVA